ncbi:response regulator transcription factor [Frankia sp. RB7]|nr:response regulator transcription factor [Frankia sp. RB7]
MKFLIVDDHSILRAGISVLLKQENPDAVVVEASDGEQALALAEAQPDLDAVLLDLQMPGVGGQSVLEEFGRRFPGLPVVILTSTEDPEEVRKSLSSGALGYVPKSASSTTLIGALKLVLQGDVYVPPLMLNERPREIPTNPPAASLRRLTQRQSDVLRLVQRGISNKLIARELGLSEKTVKVHVTSILKALNVTTRTAAITAVQELLKTREK